MKFYIDWSDLMNPEIKPLTDEDSIYTETQTFSDAKREIINHFSDIIDQAQGQIDKVRSLKQQDVVKEDQP